MRIVRPHPSMLLPIALAILALLLFLIVPALTGAGRSHALPASAAAAHR